jgi:hypothetical protein
MVSSAPQRIDLGGSFCSVDLWAAELTGGAVYFTLDPTAETVDGSAARLVPGGPMVSYRSARPLDHVWAIATGAGAGLSILAYN